MRTPKAWFLAAIWLLLGSGLVTSLQTVLVFVCEAGAASACLWQHRDGEGSERNSPSAVSFRRGLRWSQEPPGYSGRVFNLVPRSGVLRALVLSPA